MRHAVLGAGAALWLSLQLLACDNRLRLVVVEAGGSSGLSLGGQGGVGSPSPVAGSVSEGGSVETGGVGATGAAQPDDGPAAAGEGGTPAIDPWDAAALYTASYTSHAFPQQHVRHVDGKGFIGVINLASAIDREDASFDIIPGLYEKTNLRPDCVSIRAVNKRGAFLRHAGSRIYLDPAENVPLYLADATFCIEPGLADANGISFRSANYPDALINLRNQDELWIDDFVDTPEFAAAATFYQVVALNRPE